MSEKTKARVIKPIDAYLTAGDFSTEAKNSLAENLMKAGADLEVNPLKRLFWLCDEAIRKNTTLDSFGFIIEYVSEMCGLDPVESRAQVFANKYFIVDENGGARPVNWSDFADTSADWKLPLQDRMSQVYGDEPPKPFITIHDLATEVVNITQDLADLVKSDYEPIDFFLALRNFFPVDLVGFAENNKYLLFYRGKWADLSPERLEKFQKSLSRSLKKVM